MAANEFEPSRVAARLVREALRIDEATEDTTALRVSARRALDGLSASQRTQLVGHLAVLAAGLADLVAPHHREVLLGAAELPAAERDLLTAVYGILMGAEIDGTAGAGAAL